MVSFDSGDVLSLQPGKDKDNPQLVLDLEQVQDKVEDIRNLEQEYRNPEQVCVEGKSQPRGWTRSGTRSGNRFLHTPALSEDVSVKTDQILLASHA